MPCLKGVLNEEYKLAREENEGVGDALLGSD